MNVFSPSSLTHGRLEFQLNEKREKSQMSSNWHHQSHVPARPLDHLSMSQHRTPIKRISQGSLRALSRSANYPDAPHGLGFLTPALAELTEEMQTLQSHTQGLRNLEISLTRFNESFASWLYVQNMASLTLDWTQVPFFLIDPIHALNPPSRLPSRHLFCLRNNAQVIHPHPPSSFPSPPCSPLPLQNKMRLQLKRL